MHIVQILHNAHGANVLMHVVNTEYHAYSATDFMNRNFELLFH